MQFSYHSLADSRQASGAVVVIDVIRAFTTAACAFAVGARDITLVGAVDDAWALREEMPEALLMGEVSGFPVEGFDLGNSPVEVLERDLTGARLIQRTSSGTQGVVRADHAPLILTSSFVCAGATARYLERLNPANVSFISTGVTPAGLGDEDVALADYLSAVLRGEHPSPEPYLERVLNAHNAGWTRRNDSNGDRDLEICVNLDRYPFAMQVEREDGRLVMRPVHLT